jgi:hypothetical protein
MITISSISFLGGIRIALSLPSSYNTLKLHTMPKKATPKAHQDTSSMDVQQPPQPSVTPETDIETETLTLRGPNKRTRDDELRQIEVDKARLDLDRLRKTTEFEEQQRLRETAINLRA